MRRAVLLVGMLGHSGCSLLITKPLPADYSPQSRRAPSCDDSARVGNVADLLFVAGGLAEISAGGYEARAGNAGGAILAIGLGVAQVLTFAHSADLGDDRAAECRAALLDYQYELAKSLRSPAPAPVTRPPTREPDREPDGDGSDDTSDKDGDGTP